VWYVGDLSAADATSACGCQHNKTGCTDRINQIIRDTAAGGRATPSR